MTTQRKLGIGNKLYSRIHRFLSGRAQYLRRFLFIFIHWLLSCHSETVEAAWNSLLLWKTTMILMAYISSTPFFNYKFTYCQFFYFLSFWMKMIDNGTQHTERNTPCVGVTPKKTIRAHLFIRRQWNGNCSVYNPRSQMCMGHRLYWMKWSIAFLGSSRPNVVSPSATAYCNGNRSFHLCIFTTWP